SRRHEIGEGFGLFNHARPLRPVRRRLRRNERAGRPAARAPLAFFETERRDHLLGAGSELANLAGDHQFLRNGRLGGPLLPMRHLLPTVPATTQLPHSFTTQGSGPHATKRTASAPVHRQGGEPGDAAEMTRFPWLYATGGRAARDAAAGRGPPQG